MVVTGQQDTDQAPWSQVQQEQLTAVRAETLEQIPEAVAEEDREALADARARQEVLGEEPDEDYQALVGQVADQVEQGYQASYENAGVEEDSAAIAAAGQRKQFLGQSVSDEESEAIAAAEETVEAKRKEYGRTINHLKDQYRSDLGGVGDTELMDSAAQIRASEQVYGNEPTEKQAGLLGAADSQRRAGVARQLQGDYETSGAPTPLAQSAGDIKAQEYVSDRDLTESQEQRVEQADRYLTSPEGQLKRAQAQSFQEQQVGQAYREGRTAQALEDAGVESELASKAAKIEVQTGDDPELPEDAETLQAAYGSANGLGSPIDTDIAQNAETFMNTAQSAGVTASVGGAEVAQGNNYTMSRTAGVTVVENQETGGSVASRDGEVLDAEGMTEQDQTRFQKLAQVSPEDLQQATQPEPSTERSDGMELD